CAALPAHDRPPQTGAPALRSADENAQRGDARTRHLQPGPSRVPSHHRYCDRPDRPTEEELKVLEAPMPQLTEWLKLMVAEINRKHEDADAAKKEDAARQ